MPGQISAPVYTQGFGTAPSAALENAFVSNTDPTSTNVMGPGGPFPIGQRWINSASNNVWTLASKATLAGATTATWVQDSAGSGALNQLTGDTGTALPSSGSIAIAGGSGITTSASGATVTIALAGGSVAMDSFVPDAGTNPVVPTAAGAVTMAGTANQITTTGGLNTLTFSLPSSITAPGSLTTTTTLNAGTSITAATTLSTTNGDITAGGSGRFIGSTGCIINAGNQPVSLAADPGTSSVTLGAGGTRTVEIGNNTAGTTVTLQSQTGTLALAAGASPITLTSSPDILAVGNLNFQTAGNKIKSANVGSGTSAGDNSFGSVTLTGGTATVSTTAVTASSLIYLSRMSVGATGANDLGILSVGSIVAATSFEINAWTVTNATALQTDDVSVVAWFIVN